MIETVRLRLRRGTEADIPDLLAALNDWGIAQWLARPPYPFSADDARAFLRWGQPPGELAPPKAYVVADRVSDRLLGVASLEPQQEDAELGYWLAAAAQGRGYMREAVAALLNEDVDRLPGTPTVYATTDPENRRSQALLLGFGFHRVAVQNRKQPTRRGSSSVLRFELNSRVRRPEQT